MYMQISSKVDIKNLGTIIGIWAHPDDETYSSGGIMAAAVLNGQKVICITATKGEAGVQDESRWPSDKLASIREKELQKVLKILGIVHHHWLGYKDGGCADVAEDEAVSKITALLDQYQPDTILTFGADGMTGHTDHQAVSRWAGLANKKSKNVAVIYHAIQTEEQYVSMLEADKELNVFFNIDKPQICKDCDCDICFNLDKEMFSRKVEALRAMPSQTEPMLKMFSHVLPQTVGIEAFKIYTE